METNKVMVETLFSQYKATLDKCALWEDKIFSSSNRNELASVLRQRSRILRDVFTQNNATITQMMELLYSPTEETAAAFSDCIQAMGVDRYDDAALLYALLNKLIPYYESKNDRDMCILLYNRRAWEATAMLRMGGSEEDFPAVERYEDILRYADQYGDIQDADVRAKFMIAYYNIIVVMPTIGIISVEKSYEYYIKMLAFWVSEQVQRLDGNSPKIRGFVNRIRTGWLAVENQIDKESDEMKRRFSEIAIRAYQRGACSSRESRNKRGYISRLHPRALY